MRDKKAFLERRERQRGKGKIYQTECRIPENSNKINNVNKYRKAKEWEKLEISSRELIYQGNSSYNHSGNDKGQE